MIVENFLFPNKFYNDILKVNNVISSNKKIFSFSEQMIEIVFDKDIYKFPYRLYSEDIDSSTVEMLNNDQKIILHCIYSRNANGFIRQKHIKILLDSEIPYLANPYVFKICDEYIIEILYDVYNNIKKYNNKNLKKLCNENINLLRKSYNRMVSYWNEYYRENFPNFNNYIGYKIFTECFGIKK